MIRGPPPAPALSAGTQPKARISYSAAWFDGADRQIAAANYGAISSFTRPTTPPPSSATILVNQTTYDVAGRVYQTTDPMGNVNQNTYDSAGRRTQLIEALGSPVARTTQWSYNLDDLITTMTAVNSTTGNQITTWNWGTSSTSGVYRNDLLNYIDYPDSVSGSDRVSYTYNRLGQPQTVTDQRGTVRTFYYDKLGRLTDDAVSTVGSNTDNAVLRISRTYEVRGMLATISSYDNATPGSGTCLNQCALTYNSFGQLIEEQQEHSGTVTSSSVNVQYSYDSGGSSSNEIRPATITYPNGRVITYYHGTSGSMDDFLNRITAIQDGSTNLAQYTWLGLATAIRIDYTQPQVRLDLWGGTSGVFNGLDLFNRVIDQRWINYNTSTDLDRYQYGYDQNSNRLWKANLLTSGLDEFYVYDQLNRLTLMQRGTLNGTKTGITGTPVREMDYSLDPTGNWSAYLTKTGGTTDLNQTRTANKVNEITGISSTPTWAAPAYDPAGNMTTMPQTSAPSSSFNAVYDAWNRPVSVSAGGTMEAQYKYDGRNRRIIRLAYASGVLSETRHLYFTDVWQDVEQRVGSSTSADQQHLWGVRFLDELVCRDRTSERLYATQDCNLGITGLLSSAGAVQQRITYDPYGNPTVLSPSWVVTTDSYSWAYRFQGRLFDLSTLLLHVRYSDLHPLLGIWLQREEPDLDSGNLYATFGSNPIARIDPLGQDYYSDSGFQGEISRETFNDLRSLIEQQEGIPHGGLSGMEAVDALWGARDLGWNLRNMSAQRILQLARERTRLENRMVDIFWQAFLNDCNTKCVLQFLENSIPGLGLLAGGRPWLPKRFTLPGTSPGTSLWSRLARLAFPWNLPFRVPVPKGGLPFTWRASASVGGIIGRYLPWLGLILIGYNLAVLLDCVSKCKCGKSTAAPAPGPGTSQPSAAPAPPPDEPLGPPGRAYW